jgi:hypothetical protein
MQDAQESPEQEARDDFPCTSGTPRARALRWRQHEGASRLKRSQGLSLHFREEYFHHVLIDEYRYSLNCVGRSKAGS